jgi:hypothetical protein
MVAGLVLVTLALLITAIRDMLTRPQETGSRSLGLPDTVESGALVPDAPDFFSMPSGDYLRLRVRPGRYVAPQADRSVQVLIKKRSPHVRDWITVYAFQKTPVERIPRALWDELAWERVEGYYSPR